MIIQPQNTHSYEGYRPQWMAWVGGLVEHLRVSESHNPSPLPFQSSVGLKKVSWRAGQTGTQTGAGSGPASVGPF